MAWRGLRGSRSSLCEIKVFFTRERVNVKFRTLLQAMNKELFSLKGERISLTMEGLLLEFVIKIVTTQVKNVRSLYTEVSNVPHVACNVWVRSLYSLPRPWSNVKVPHLACKVWVRSSYSLVVCLERDLCLSYTLHTLTFSMRTNSVLTPCKQGAVLSRYSLGPSLLWPE